MLIYINWNISIRSNDHMCRGLHSILLEMVEKQQQIRLNHEILWQLPHHLQPDAYLTVFGGIVLVPFPIACKDVPANTNTRRNALLDNELVFRRQLRPILLTALVQYLQTFCGQRNKLKMR